MTDRKKESTEWYAQQVATVGKKLEALGYEIMDTGGLWFVLSYGGEEVGRYGFEYYNYRQGSFYPPRSKLPFVLRAKRLNGKARRYGTASALIKAIEKHCRPETEQEKENKNTREKLQAQENICNRTKIERARLRGRVGELLFRKYALGKLDYDADIAKATREYEEADEEVIRLGKAMRVTQNEL